MRRRLLAGAAGALAVGLALFASLSGPRGSAPLVSRLQAQRRAIAISGGNSLLSILSPPGAGYDSTSVALGTGSGAAVTVSRASTQTCEVRENYLSLTGASGSYASTPDSDALDITGDLDLRARLSLSDWTPAALQSALTKYFSAGNQRSYLLQVTSTGLLSLWLSPDGTGASANQATSTVATGIADGTAKWIRATWRKSDRRTQFFLSDDGSTWTQLGTDVTHPVSSVFASTSVLSIGGKPQDNAELLAGRVYSASVRNGIDGTVVAKFDAADTTAGTTSFASRTTGETWTVSSPAAINDTLLTSVVANKPCVESGALRVEPSGTNLLLRSEELDNAAWLDSATPTVTANSWDFGTGSATGETIDDNDAASSEGRAQTFATATTGTYTVSCYFRSDTLTTARLLINATGTAPTGNTTCTFTGLSSVTSRQSCTAALSASPMTGVLVAPFPGSLASDTGSIKVGGCQLETGSVATSYIPTAGATASRAAQTTTVPKPAGLSTTEGSAKVCVTPAFTGTNPVAVRSLFLDGNALGTAFLAYVVSGQDTFRAFDGTSFPGVAAGFTAGVRKCYRTSWSASRNVLRVENLTAGTSAQDVFSGFPSFGANIGVGVNNAASSQTAWGKLDSICLSASPDSCR